MQPQEPIVTITSNPQLTQPQKSKGKIIGHALILVLVINILAAVWGAIAGGGGEGGLGYLIVLMFINGGLSLLYLLIAIVKAIGRKGDGFAYFLAAVLVGIVGFGSCYGSVVTLDALGVRGF